MSVAEPIDGVYTLRRKVGEGGMAEVYHASVNLETFDYSLLYAYTQVDGKTHADRQEAARELVKRLDRRALDPWTVRALLEAQHIPVPAVDASVKISKAGADVERFKAEWQYLLCLSHPNVIAVYGGGEYKGRPYYAMEYLPTAAGITRACRAQPLERSIRLAVRAGYGLAYLHEMEIVHRDVKPSNILVGPSRKGGRRVRVADLGLAKALDGSIRDRLPNPCSDGALDGSPGQTLSRQVLGTARYMAPEQVLSPQTVDSRADVYGLAATIHELASGEPPFPGEMSFMDIVREHARGTQPPLEAERAFAAMPGDLARILRKAMQRRPGMRYASMDDMLHELEAFLGVERGLA
jgi:serine/threonine protein kinase